MGAVRLDGTAYWLLIFHNIFLFTRNVEYVVIYLYFELLPYNNS